MVRDVCLLVYSDSVDDKEHIQSSVEYPDAPDATSQDITQKDASSTGQNVIQTFLPTHKLLEKMKGSPVHEHVPVGVKENVFFVVANNENKTRALNGKRQQWWDDCGAYASINGSKSHYIVEDRNSFTEVKLTKGKYAKEVQVKGQTSRVPLEPQPDPENILTINRLYSKLKHDPGIPLDWTNNNCESVNNMLKSFVNWKKMQLPLLISKLREIVSIQEQDIERALRGTGNYYLAPNAAHYRVDPYFWRGLTSQQKRKRVEEFTENKRRVKNMVTSSDGRLMVLSSPTGGRKPGEPKRKRAKMTYTPLTQ